MIQKPKKPRQQNLAKRNYIQDICLAYPGRKWVVFV